MQKQITGSSTESILSEMVEKLKAANVEEAQGNYFESEAWHNKLLKKAELYNSVKGNLGYFNCTKCNNKGVIQYITDDWN